MHKFSDHAIEGKHDTRGGRHMVDGSYVPMKGITVISVYLESGLEWI
jgi:hypothetical protein